MTRVLHRALTVGVERDLHLDHHVDVLAACGPALAMPAGDVGQQGIAVQFGRLAAGAYEAIGDLAGVLGRSTDPPPAT